MPNIGKDIRDLEVEDLLGYDAVLHLAGLSNDPLGFLNPETTFDINYRASVRLGEIAKSAEFDVSSMHLLAAITARLVMSSLTRQGQATQ